MTPSSSPRRRTRSAQDAVLMLGAIGVVAAVVGGAFLVLQSLARDPVGPPVAPGSSLLGVAPSPSVKAWATRHPAGTPAPDHTKPPAPTRRPASAPRPRPRPSASAEAYVNPGPSLLPDGRIVYTLRGDEYETADVPANGTLIERPTGSISLETTRDYSYQLTVTYVLPADVVPDGKRIIRIDTRVCGDGEGDFWETYGPEGSDTLEHEVTAPGRDGCWHYVNAPDLDPTVIVIIRLQSKMTIDRVEYTVTVA